MCDGTIVDVTLQDGKPSHYASPTNSRYVTETFLQDTGNNANSAQTCKYNGTAWTTTDNNQCDTPRVWNIIFGDNNP
jgi:hypothetical protein